MGYSLPTILSGSLRNAGFMPSKPHLETTESESVLHFPFRNDVVCMNPRQHFKRAQCSSSAWVNDGENELYFMGVTARGSPVHPRRTVLRPCQQRRAEPRPFSRDPRHRHRGFLREARPLPAEDARRRCCFLRRICCAEGSFSCSQGCGFAAFLRGLFSFG